MKIKQSGVLILFLFLFSFQHLSCSEERDDSVPSSLYSQVGLAPSLPTIVIPENTRFKENAHIKLDKNLMAQIGAGYCMESGGDPDALDFYGGYLPMLSADQFCHSVFNKEQMQNYLGNMYISGLYGGLWLRDVLFSNPQDGERNKMIDMLRKMIPAAAVPAADSGFDQSIFEGFANAAGAAVDVSLTGTAKEVRVANHLFVPAGLIIYGYDYGYYYYLIDNPIEGIPPFEDPLLCNDFMDCRMAAYELETLTRYKPVLDSLFNPPSLEWIEMNLAAIIFGKGSVALGDLAWESIMARSTMFDNAYLPLIDLSARFMLVSELTLLPTMKGYAESDEAAGRCGLLQQAGMIVWLGSYVQGLASTLPEGMFPDIICP